MQNIPTQIRSDATGVFVYSLSAKSAAVVLHSQKMGAGTALGENNGGDLLTHLSTNLYSKCNQNPISNKNLICDMEKDDDFLQAWLDMDGVRLCELPAELGNVSNQLCKINGERAVPIRSIVIGLIERIESNTPECDLLNVIAAELKLIAAYTYLVLPNNIVYGNKSDAEYSQIYACSASKESGFDKMVEKALKYSKERCLANLVAMSIRDKGIKAKSKQVLPAEFRQIFETAVNVCKRPHVTRNLKKEDEKKMLADILSLQHSDTVKALFPNQQSEQSWFFREIEPLMFGSGEIHWGENLPSSVEENFNLLKRRLGTSPIRKMMKDVILSGQEITAEEKEYFTKIVLSEPLYEEEYFIKCAHKWRKSEQKGAMDVYIEWEDYPEKEDRTWEDFDELEDGNKWLIFNNAQSSNLIKVLPKVEGLIGKGDIKAVLPEDDDEEPMDYYDEEPMDDDQGLMVSGYDRDLTFVP